MSHRTTSQKVDFIINIIYSAIILLLIFLLIKYSLGFVYPFIFAILIGLAVEPFVSTLQNKLNIKRSYCSFFCVVIFDLVIFALITLLVSSLYTALKSFLISAPMTIQKINEYLDILREKANLNEASFIELGVIQIFEKTKNTNIESVIGGNLGSKLIDSITEIMKSIPEISIGIIISIVASVFVSSSLPQIKSFLLNQLSIERKKMLINFKHNIYYLSKKYIKAYLILMSVTFLQLSILFFIFKINPALVLAFVISLVDILPVFGVGTVLIPWSIVCFITGDVSKATVLLSIYLLVTVIRQIIEPKLISKSIGLHPVITLITIYIGFKLFGIIGMILLPITAMIIIEMNKNGVINLWKSGIDN